MSIIERYKNTLLNNKSLLFTGLNKFSTLFFGGVNIILITTCLSPVEQGYYYTFNSLILFQGLFDIGFGTVLSQFISHEWAFLNLDINDNIVGEEYHKQKLFALIKIGKKWYLGISIVFFFVVGFLGYRFLQINNSTSISYLMPWILLCISVSLSIILLPFRYFLEGANQIHKSQKILLMATTAGYVVSWFFLHHGAGIYTIVVYSFCNFSLTLFGVWRYAKSFVKTPVQSDSFNSFSFWKSDFFTQQWKIALSSIAGYLMYQLFVPLAFEFEGPIVAGKMGATLQIFNAILAIGYIFPNVSAPKIGMLGAQKKYAEIVKIVNRVSLISVVITFFSVLGFIGFMLLLPKIGFHQFTQKFIDLKWMSIFLVTTIIMQRIAIETIAVRYQKKEPYLLCSIISALVTSALMFFLGKAAGTKGIIISFWIGTVIVGFTWSHLVYKAFFKSLIKTNQ
jgi:O-antigen/teichoic acid export membrane protein